MYKKQFQIDNLYWHLKYKSRPSNDCTSVFIKFCTKTQVTNGFLNSFGLIHLTKNGWQAWSVFIRESKDFLNCAPSDGDLFLVSSP